MRQRRSSPTVPFSHVLAILSCVLLTPFLISYGWALEAPVKGMQLPSSLDLPVCGLSEPMDHAFLYKDGTWVMHREDAHRPLEDSKILLFADAEASASDYQRVFSMLKSVGIRQIWLALQRPGLNDWRSKQFYLSIPSLDSELGGIDPDA
jgi:hypothetical protein